MTMRDEDAVKVQLINPEDIKIAYTEEVEPEHFVAAGFVLPALGLTSGDQADYNANDPVQILQLDPMRKEAIITFNGSGGVYLAHSITQAMELQLGTNQQAASATLVTCPTTIRASGSGPLWAVLASSTGTPTTPNNGNSLQLGATQTPTTTHTVIGSATFTTPPAGQWIINGYVYVDGTVVTADDEDNFALANAGGLGTILAPIMCPAESGSTPIYAPFGPITVTLNGVTNVTMQTNAKTPSGTAVYHVQIYMTPVAGSSPASGTVSVGVFTQRRGV